MKGPHQALTNLKEELSSFMKYLTFSFSLIENLDHYYTKLSADNRKKLLITLFPEKLIYDKENSGFFMTRKGHDKNINIRIKEDTDSVIPSASSVAVLNLLRLSRFTDSKEYISIAEKTMRSVLARINQSPDQAAQLLVSMIFSLAKPVEIMIAGEKNNENTSLMLQKVYDRYIQGRIVILVNNGDTRQKLAGLLPFISSVKRVSKKTTAYICTNRTCNTPVTDPEAIDRLLN